MRSSTFETIEEQQGTMTH